MNSLRSAWTLFFAGHPILIRRRREKLGTPNPLPRYTLYQIGTKYRSGSLAAEQNEDVEVYDFSSLAGLPGMLLLLI